MMSSYETSPKSKLVFSEVYVQKRGTCVTVIILGVIIGIFAIAYITFGNDPTDNSQKVSHTLKFVNVVLNNGQSSPKFTYPTDMYRNNSRWHVGLGELSKRGKQITYNLGKFYRERYSGFLPELYFSTDLQVLSSNADLCLMTAAVFLAGLYPPHKFQIWNPHILWQPIPIKGISEEMDMMLDVSRNCPQLVRKLQIIGLDILKKDETLAKLYKYFTKHTGMKVQNLSSILALYNLFTAQERNNLILPEWLQSVYPNNMLKYAIKALLLETEDSEITRLSTGMLLKKIVSDTIKKKENSISEKMFLYSAHEKSIMNILRVLDTRNSSFVNTKPEFSASIIIEMHYINNATVIKAYYLEKVGKTPSFINITECGDPCVFDDFIKFTKSLIPNNWEDECSL